MERGEKCKLPNSPTLHQKNYGAAIVSWRSGKRMVFSALVSACHPLHFYSADNIQTIGFVMWPDWVQPATGGKKNAQMGKNTSLHPFFLPKYLIYNTWGWRCGMQASTCHSRFDSTLTCFPLVIRGTLFVDLFYSWHQFGRNPQSHVSQVYCPSVVAVVLLFIPMESLYAECPQTPNEF